MNNDQISGERIAIIGAGISGLSLGWLLSRLGKRVTIFESADRIGGLARTFEWQGVPCDIAPHRLYTQDQETLAALRKLVPLRQFRRHSRILMRGKRIRDPINPIELLLRFPPRVGYALVQGFLNRPDLEEDSFESLALNRYGQGLYEFFFEPYTRKMFGVSPRDISVTWGREKLRSSGLRDTIKRGSKTFFHSFWYPEQGGYGAIGEAMREQIRGDILLEAPVTGLRYSGERIESVRYRQGGRELSFDCDQVFSTIPATRLASFFGEKLDLRFRNIQLVYLNVAKPQVMPYQWVYFGDGDIVINRMAEFKHFHPDWAEAPNSVLCAEVTVETERPEADVLSALRRYDLVDAGDVMDTMVLPERYGYPVYDRGFGRAKEQGELLFSRFNNLHCVGRNAEFRHIELDEDLGSAVACVRRIYGRAI